MFSRILSVETQMKLHSRHQRKQYVNEVLNNIESGLTHYFNNNIINSNLPNSNLFSQFSLFLNSQNWGRGCKLNKFHVIKGWTYKNKSLIRIILGSRALGVEVPREVTKN